MLVLSRKSGQSIRVGNGIVITVKAMVGGRVKLAIEAPRDVRILRGELDAHHNMTDEVTAEHDYLTAVVAANGQSVGAA